MIGHVVGPYRIVDRLGAGGMGEVYLADDPRLERKVALKCPSPEWLSQPDARERLQREARAAARLKHANIAAIYDVLDVDDRPFIVMEYVEGKGLNECLQHERLSVEQAVQIAIQIADAVTEAHANGVLHRDLKPGNIRLTTSGRVKVLDFGLAKMKPAQPETGERPSIEASLTAAGQMLGTPGYAAPEQLTGRSADQRSDIFAIGVILFEMLTGRLPCSGSDAMSLALSTVTEPAPSVRTLNTAVPPSLSAVVSRALEKDPKARFPTAAAMAAELRRVAGSLADRPTTAIAESWAPANPPVAPPTVRLSTRLASGVLAGSLAIVLIVSGIRWAADRASLGARGSPVVAVLPFIVTGDDPVLSSLAVGLADRLTSDLARLPGLVVVPRSATLAFVGPGAAARASLDQGTSHVVQGTLSPSGDGVSLDVLLISSDGRIVWARQFHGHRDNVLGLEPRVHRDLAAALIGTLNVPRAVQTTGQTDPQAARYYSDALTLLERRDIPDNIPRAIQLFNLAIDRDPRWAPPYLGLFEAYWAQYRLDKERDLPDRARAALDKARELDPDYPGLHYRMALHYRNTGKTAEAMVELDQAIADEPNGDAAYTQRGQILYERGDIEAGLADFQKVVELRPTYLRGWTTLAVAAQRRGRVEEAERAYVKATQLQPESPAGYAGLAAIYHVTRRLAQAEESYKTAIRLGAEGNVRDNFGQLYWETGRYREAVETLERLVKDIPGREIYWRHLGDAYAAAGRGEEALSAYRQAVKVGQDELKINPRDGRTLASVAVSEAKAGLPEQARLHALQAVGFNPRDSDVLYRATVVNLLSGDRASALTYLRQAIEAGYSAARVAEDRDLAPLRSSQEFKDIVSSAPKG